mmetsp:Transcript_39541/g.76874  ORF Transcript_39541/g.76874 Transcript_39541/m.76874 type:complete len:261 (+) Transcript_39541:487-1269(+)
MSAKAEASGEDSKVQDSKVNGLLKLQDLTGTDTDKKTRKLDKNADVFLFENTDKGPVQKIKLRGSKWANVNATQCTEEMTLKKVEDNQGLLQVNDVKLNADATAGDSEELLVAPVESKDHSPDVEDVGSMCAAPVTIVGGLPQQEDGSDQSTDLEEPEMKNLEEPEMIQQDVGSTENEEHPRAISLHPCVHGVCGEPETLGEIDLSDFTTPMEDSKMLLVFFHGEVGGVQHAAVMDFSDLLSTDDESEEEEDSMSIPTMK